MQLPIINVTLDDGRTLVANVRLGDLARFERATQTSVGKVDWQSFDVVLHVAWLTLKRQGETIDHEWLLDHVDSIDIDLGKAASAPVLPTG